MIHEESISDISLCSLRGERSRLLACVLDNGDGQSGQDDVDTEKGEAHFKGIRPACVDVYVFVSASELASPTSQPTLLRHFPSCVSFLGTY